MPLFVVHALDKADGGAAIRATNRPAHIEWAVALGERLRIGGPLMSDDGEHMIGSMLVIEYEGLEELRTFLKTDPYAIGGLFQSVDVHPYKWLIGADMPAA